MHLDGDIKEFVKSVYIGCAGLCAVELVGCGVFSLLGWVSFSFSMVIGSIGGTAVGMICFLWMAVALQKSLDEAEKGGTFRKGVQSGYWKRLTLQGVWVVACVFLDAINPICGLLPLLFPKAAIYVLQITGKLNLTAKKTGTKGGES